RTSNRAWSGAASTHGPYNRGPNARVWPPVPFSLEIRGFLNGPALGLAPAAGRVSLALGGIKCNAANVRPVRLRDRISGPSGRSSRNRGRSRHARDHAGSALARLRRHGQAAADQGETWGADGSGARLSQRGRGGR